RLVNVSRERVRADQRQPLAEAVFEFCGERVIPGPGIGAGFDDLAVIGEGTAWLHGSGSRLGAVGKAQTIEAERPRDSSVDVEEGMVAELLLRSQFGRLNAGWSVVGVDHIEAGYSRRAERTGGERSVEIDRRRSGVGEERRLRGERRIRFQREER